jgi:hypothetical protein
MRPYTEDLLNLFVSGTKKISVVHVTLANGTVYRFLHSDVGNPSQINSLDYQKRLVEMGGLKESPFNTSTNRQSITISTNEDDDIPGGEWGLLAADATYPLRMAKVDSYTYLPETGEFLYYWDGYLSQPIATEPHVKASVIDQKEAAGFCFANQTISARNGFVNPDPDESTPPFGGDDNIGGGENPIGGYCFVRGTSVHSDFNESRFNHNFEVGDEILTFNPETLERVIGTVKKVFYSRVDEYLRVEFSNKKSIGVTAYHPFFTEHKLWTPICQIPLGTKVYDLSGDKPKLVKLTRTKLIKESAEVITFECEPFADYLADGFGVANRKPEPIDLPGDQQIQF